MDMFEVLFYGSIGFFSGFLVSTHLMHKTHMRSLERAMLELTEELEKEGRKRV